MSDLSFTLLIISKFSLFTELETYDFTCQCRDGHERGRADGEDGGCFLFFHKKSIPGVHALMTCALLEINATKRACSGNWLIGLDK